MKKSIILVLVVVMAASTLMMSGCTAMKATNQAKEMLAKYFDYYNDEDIDECIDMFGDEIIDDLDDDDDVVDAVFYSRRYILGEMDDYEIVSFESDGSFGSAQVLLNVDVEYENQDEAVEEEYIFHLEDGKMEIAGIDFDENSVVDSYIEGYFEKYYDMNHIQKYYIPYFNENFFSQEELMYWSGAAQMAGGEYKDHEVINYDVYYDELPWDDDIYLISIIEAELELEYENFMLYAEFSAEDAELGFNFVEYYPLDVYKTLEGYYAAAAEKDTNSMMNIYVNGFFENEEFTAADWETSIFGAMVNDYGKFVDYTIYSWEPTTTAYNGQEYNVYSVVALAEYEGISLEEHFVFLVGQSRNAIIGHQIY